MTYFWADTHFNHAACIGLCRRPYRSVREMNDDLTARWNATVRRSDTIYHLGDFAFSSRDGEPLCDLFARLNGHKHLLVGNHDDRNRKVLKLQWESVSSLRTVRENGMRAVVCHYPIESWNHRGRALMLHGHCHGNLRRVVAHRFDVGCDVRLFPVSLESLWAEAAAQTWEPVDHHDAREVPLE